MTTSRVPVLFLLFCAAPFAQADINYIYLGNDFTSQTGPWPTDPTRITFSVTLANAIPANSFVEFLGFPPGSDLLAWSASDGIRTITEPDVGRIQLYTDGQGNIRNWIIAVGSYYAHPTSNSFANEHLGARQFVLYGICLLR